MNNAVNYNAVNSMIQGIMVNIITENTLKVKGAIILEEVHVKRLKQKLADEF